MKAIVVIFIAALLIRSVSLFKSRVNEKKLRRQNAKEYGKHNSLVLTISHILYYVGCFTEAILREPAINAYTYVGIGLFVFSMVMLWIVIFSLRDLWTIKLFIAPHHNLNTSPLFKIVKHPNYFLSIIPELLAIALICQAWTVLVVGFPLYSVPLTIRIIQERDAMKSVFPDY